MHWNFVDNSGPPNHGFNGVLVHLAGVTRIPVALCAIALAPEPAIGPCWACGILQQQLADGSLKTGFGLSSDCAAGSHTNISGFHAKVCTCLAPLAMPFGSEFWPVEHSSEDAEAPEAVPSLLSQKLDDNLLTSDGHHKRR